MDNITHSLVGAALGQAGLKRRTRLGMATLVIGANLPDVDGLAYFTGGDAIGFRRGWTHGVLAIVVLPLVLSGVMLGWDRLRWRTRPRRATASPGQAIPAVAREEPASPRPLLLLSGIAVLTHPFLDWLNTYGLRWLMPFRDRWYHGDAWSIMDPWVWLVLGGGVALSWAMERRGQTAAARPARWALALAAVYGLAMLGASAAGRRAAAAALTPDGGAPSSVMVSPDFARPLAWTVVARQGDRYRVGTLALLPWRVGIESQAIPVGLDDPAARAAAASPAARSFLHWSRFPVFRVDRTPAGTVVRVFDLRYGREGWAARTFRVR